MCETFGGGVFTYVPQLYNDIRNNFDIFLAYSLRSQTSRNYKELLDKRICLIRVDSFNVKGLTSIPNDIKVIKEFRAIERRVKPDIIHLHSSIAGRIGGLAFKGKNNTIVYTPHGYAHILMGSDKKNVIYKWMKKISGRMNFITLTCCGSEDGVAKTLCKRTAYIETGIDLADLFTSLNGIESEKNEKFMVFTLGRACVQKQPQVFNEIAGLVPEARFVWIGSSELENLLIAPNIEVTGWKPREEVLTIAKGADAFVLYSLGEAITVSLIENIYIKKLILVSNTVGNRSVIRDGINGYVCEKAEEYARRIKAAVEVFPKELPERTYQDVLNIYNTAEIKKKYVKLYRSI